MTQVLNILMACSLFLFAACTGNNTPEEQTATDTTISIPPDTDTSVENSPSQSFSGPDIDQYIQTSMPGWTVPEASTWEKYWYDRYEKGKNTVYRVQEDFDGNGQTDYAFILKDNRDKYAVWAFLQNDTSYTTHRIYDITRSNRKLHVGLGVLEAGTYDDLNTTDTALAKVQTEHPAIHVIFFETAARAYYWKDGRFHLIQTGD
jgi:hypothetical protein